MIFTVNVGLWIGDPFFFFFFSLQIFILLNRLDVGNHGWEIDFIFHEDFKS
jgi:hypothetical protein